MPRTVVSPPRGIDRHASSKSAIKSPKIGARAKSASAPGVRKVSPLRQSGTLARAPTDPEKVRKYRGLLVEIYSKHAPEKNVNVDQLLEKYKGQEEFIYSTVCKRYGETEKKPEALDSVNATSRSASRKAETSTTLDTSTTHATRAKAVLPKPPGRSGDVLRKNGEAAAKRGSTRKTVANGSPDATSKLLADVDLLLIGEKTSFFDYPIKMCDSYSGSQSECSHENEEEDLAPEPVPKSAGRSSLGQAKAKVDEGSASVGSSRKLQPESEKGQKQNVKETSSKAASKAAPPKAPARTPGKETTSEPSSKTSPTKKEIGPVDDMENEAIPAADQADDSDLDDEDLSAALAARLEAKEEAAEGDNNSIPAESVEPQQIEPLASESQPLQIQKVASNQAELKDVDSGNSSPSALGSRPNKASAPPTHVKEGQTALEEVPSTSAKARASKKDANDGSGVKAKAASEPAKPPEPEAPPLFNQFVAVLKFLTGWNDQKTYTSDEIRAALCEHLEDEGIQGSSTIERLCATIVPLLLDMKSIDMTIVKNVKKDILKNLKIIQIYILRIVTFELKREIDAKAAVVADGKKTKKDRAQLKAGAPYLSGDISSLAKTVQHFRFEGAFSGGLQKLITQIRAQKKVTASSKAADGDPKGAAKTTTGSDTTVTKRKIDEASKVADGDPKGASGDDAPVAKRNNVEASRGVDSNLQDTSKAASGDDAPDAKRNSDEASKAAGSDSKGASKAGSGDDAPTAMRKTDEIAGNTKKASLVVGTTSAGDVTENAEKAPLKRQRRMV